MNRCSCNREKCTYPECDDGPVPVPAWNRVHTAAALANLANEIAKLQDRVAALESQKTTLQNQVILGLEKLRRLIESMEADS